jgi:hypothetical protein
MNVQRRRSAQTKWSRNQRDREKEKREKEREKN